MKVNELPDTKISVFKMLIEMNKNFIILINVIKNLRT